MLNIRRGAAIFEGGRSKLPRLTCVIFLTAQIQIGGKRHNTLTRRFSDNQASSVVSARLTSKVEIQSPICRTAFLILHMCKEGTMIGTGMNILDK